MKTIIIPLLLLVLVSCSPKVYDEIIEHRQPSDSGKEFILYTGEHTHVSRNIPEDEIVRLPWLGPQ